MIWQKGDPERFICTAHLTPDGLFWSVWDRLRSVQLMRPNEYKIARAYCDALNQNAEDNKVRINESA